MTDTNKTKVLALSSLAKVRLDGPDTRDQTLPEQSQAWIFGGGSHSFQLATYLDQVGCAYLTLDTEGLPEGVSMTIRRVAQVPVQLAAYPDRHDEHYISTEPGLYPDVLQEADPDLLFARGHSWESYWIELTAEKHAPAFDGPVTFTVKPTLFPLTVEDGEPKRVEDDPVLFTYTLNLHVVGQALPEQTLQTTTWFHADSLADHYDLETWSEEHWEVTRAFIQAAVRRVMNMILTPVFTPPLDTAIGSYRTNVQLVDVIS